MECVLSEAFLVIDVQNDFCPGGALAVLDGDMICLLYTSDAADE